MEESIGLKRVKSFKSEEGLGKAWGTIQKVHRRVVKEKNDLSENYVFFIDP